MSLNLGIENPAWHDQAACRACSQDLIGEFIKEFSLKKNVPLAESSQAAMRVCRGCPVFRDCRRWCDEKENHTLSPNGLIGIYAGETPLMRVSRRRVEREELKRALSAW